jgi:hypothetical protein
VEFCRRAFFIENEDVWKTLACLERNFLRGKGGVAIKRRDFYDLKRFMQKQIHPLEEKLAADGSISYTFHQSAMQALRKKIGSFNRSA